jgi:hypothetical protein
MEALKLRQTLERLGQALVVVQDNLRFVVEDLL